MVVFLAGSQARSLLGCLPCGTSSASLLRVAQLARASELCGRPAGSALRVVCRFVICADELGRWMGGREIAIKRLSSIRIVKLPHLLSVYH